MLRPTAHGRHPGGARARRLRRRHHGHVADDDVARHRDVQRTGRARWQRRSLVHRGVRRAPCRITLTQIGPPADVVVGLGIGIPQANGSGCHLTQTMQTGASSAPQLTVAVDAGTYCVRLYDPGHARGAGRVQRDDRAAVAGAGLKTRNYVRAIIGGCHHLRGAPFSAWAPSRAHRFRRPACADAIAGGDGAGACAPRPPPSGSPTGAIRPRRTTAR